MLSLTNQFITQIQEQNRTNLTMYIHVMYHNTENFKRQFSTDANRYHM